MMEHPDSNRWADITDTFDQKLAAFMSHTSQHRDPQALPGHLCTMTRQNAQDAGFPPNHLAESFTVIRLC